MKTDNWIKAHTTTQKRRYITIQALLICGPETKYVDVLLQKSNTLGNNSDLRYCSTYWFFLMLSNKLYSPIAKQKKQQNWYATYWGPVIIFYAKLWNLVYLLVLLGKSVMPLFCQPTRCSYNKRPNVQKQLTKALSQNTVFNQSAYYLFFEPMTFWWSSTLMIVSN